MAEEFMDNSNRSDWKPLLQRTVDETDKVKLRKLADELESAIFMRCQELQCGDDEEAERQAIKEATRTLLQIRVDKLGFPLDPKILSDATRGGKLQE
jgi:hypothetical protein